MHKKQVVTTTTTTTRRRKQHSTSEEIEMIKKYHVWMLKADGNDYAAGEPNSEELRHQEDLFEVLKEKCLNPQWITSAECLEKEFSADDFYIIPAFRGRIFNHLTRLKCRVYGPLALSTCLKRNERLPKRHSPVWCTALKGAIICFTGIDMETRKRQMRLVKLLGGTITKAFTGKVTHVVADSQDTQFKKFVASVDCSVPVMSVDWIFAAWDAAVKKFSERRFTDEEFIREYKLKIFAKCVITCSGVPPQDRPSLAQIIETNGGIYTGYMTKNHNTHLVSDLNSGAKYQTAQKWGWELIKTGYRLPERIYETGRTITIGCSTPRSSQNISTSQLPPLEISAIPRLTAQQQTTSAIGPAANASALQPRETDSEPRLRVLRVLEPRGKGSDVSEGGGVTMSQVNESTLSERNQAKTEPEKQRSVTDDRILSFDVENFHSSEFMQECAIYLCGISYLNIDRYRLLLDKVKAKQCDSLGGYPHVTHIVVGPQKPDFNLLQELKQKARLKEKVKVVTSDWLLDCAKAQKILDVSDYLIFRREDSIHQYSEQLAESVIVKRAKLKITPIGTKLLGTTVGLSSNPDPGSSKENDGERTLSDEEDSGDRHLFSGLTFRVLVTSEDLMKQFFTDIQSRGGEILIERKIWVNYMVCEMLDYCLREAAPHYNCGDVVSPFWLRDCIQRGAVMHVDKHPLYRPLRGPRESQMFEGCVVALSTFMEAEIDVYSNILYKFGAQVKRRLGRNGQGKELSASTHLVAGAETDRTEFARRLGIPVLDPSWLLESVLQHQLQPTDSYVFCDQPYKNYTRKDTIWMKAKQKEPISKAKRKSRDKERLSQENPNEPPKEVIPACDTTNVSEGQLPAQNPEKPPTQDTENTGTAAEDRNVEARDQNVGGGFKENAPVIDPKSTVKAAPDLDLREAYAYVDAMNTQNTAANTSRTNETWSDTAVIRVLGEAVVKTAKPSDSPWKPPAVAETDDRSRVQTRLGKRKFEAMAATTSALEGSSKKPMMSALESRPSEEDSTKKEMKKRIANKLADLAARRAEHVRAQEAEKEKERELEKERERKERERNLRMPKKSPRRSPRKKYEPPPQEYVGWEESSPRPIATQISNPFECDMVIALDDVSQHTENIKKSDKKDKSIREEEHEKTLTPATVFEPKHQEEQNKPSTSKVVETTTSIIAGRESEKAPEVEPQIRICFTATSGHNRDALAAMVLELNGEVCSVFDETVTHLVCAQIVRNEKLLCSIAKGLTVLDVDYITDSHAQKRWLKIDDYEWGSDRSVAKHGLSTQRFIPLALACRQWRLKIEKNPEQRAYQGWNAVFYCSRRRFADLKPIINFGGGKAQLRDDVSSLEGFTIALIEKSRFWNYAEIKKLIDNNVQCFHVDYLAKYLTLEEGSAVEEHFHPDYAAVLRRMSERHQRTA